MDAIKLKAHRTASSLRLEKGRARQHRTKPILPLIGAELFGQNNGWQTSCHYLMVEACTRIDTAEVTRQSRHIEKAADQ